MILLFSRQIFEKILGYQISWNSVHWEPRCFMRTDGRTDMAKRIVALRSFAKSQYSSVLSSVKQRVSWLVLLSVGLSANWEDCKCSEAGPARSKWPLLWRMPSFTWIVLELIDGTFRNVHTGRYFIRPLTLWSLTATIVVVPHR